MWLYHLIQKGIEFNARKFIFIEKVEHEIADKRIITQEITKTLVVDCH